MPFKTCIFKPNYYSHIIVIFDYTVTTSGSSKLHKRCPAQYCKHPRSMQKIDLATYLFCHIY